MHEKLVKNNPNPKVTIVAKKNRAGNILKNLDQKYSIKLLLLNRLAVIRNPLIIKKICKAAPPKLKPWMFGSESPIPDEIT
tara:strand:- start:188 stop:430 length:243 start_codon:yes stop_codon:yes gene_type:complete